MVCSTIGVVRWPSVVAWSLPFPATLVHHAGSHLLECWFCPDPDPFWLPLGPNSTAGSSSPSWPGLPHQVVVQSPCPVLHWGQSTPWGTSPPPPATPSFSDVSLDMQPHVATHIEEPASDEVLTPELQLAIAFKVLHRLHMVEKSRSLYVKELDLVEFLVAQVALLSSCPTVEVVCEVAFIMSPAPPSATCKVMDMNPGLIFSSAPACGCGCPGRHRQVIAHPCSGLGASCHWIRGVLQGEAA
jgi:hypothetical protein